MSEKEKAVKAPAERRYIYKLCPTCGVKLHVDAFFCWKCGNRHNWNANTKKWADEMTYGSTNPDDAIYCLRLNNIDKCMTCFNTQKGKPCDYIMCFGIGKGNCDMCDRFHSTRFMCCQEFQEKERAANMTDPSDSNGGAK